MPFDSIIARADAAALVPEEEATEIVKLTAASSAALGLMRRVTMSSKVRTQPVLSALANAYWVAGDTGLKQTTKVDWDGIAVTAEELACIAPIPDAVIDDSGFPIWNEVREALAQAVAVKLDQAVFTGTDKPASWPQQSSQRPSPLATRTSPTRRLPPAGSPTTSPRHSTTLRMMAMT